MSKFEDKNGVIEIPFPEQKYQQYLSFFSLKDIKDIKSAEEVKRFFLHLISDFRKGLLSIDELAEIATKLNTVLLSLNQKGTELEGLTYKCSELPYNLRQAAIGLPGQISQFDVFGKYLIEIMTFYYANMPPKETIALQDLQNNISQPAGPMEIDTEEIKKTRPDLYAKAEDQKSTI
jgi:hypothetical protein